MTHELRRLVVAMVSVAALTAAPIAAVATAPAAFAGCPDGETGVIYGCTPFCLPGMAMDLQTGLCVKVPPPAPLESPPPPILN